MAGTGKVNQLVANLPRSWKPRHRNDLLRLGSRYDGGYVITENIIRHTDFVVGLGIDRDWNFEEDFHRRKRCPVHCYDHTISLGKFTMDAVTHTRWLLRYPRIGNIKRLSEPVNLLPLKYISFFRGNRRHFMEEIGDDGERNTDFKKIFSRIPGGDRVFVKIDIEGGEYRVLSGLADFYERVTGIVVEFHHVIFLRDLVRTHISDLKRSFDIVHVHVNNTKGVDESGMPDVIEVTFENKNLRSGDEKESERAYPAESLDYPNSTVFAEFKLLFESGA
jgi:hypothetical protein